jgi:hypothetical protein
VRDVYPEEIPVNESVSSINSHAWQTWQGAMVVMAKKGVELDPHHYQDVTLVDFRDMAEYL